MGRRRSFAPRARQCGVPDPEPRLRAELERVPLPTGAGPQLARASWLPQRSGRDLLLRRRAALVALRDFRRVCDPGAGALADTGAASGCWVEVLPRFEPPGTFIGQTLPRGAFDVALFSLTNSPAASWAGFYGCGGIENYTGYCQRLVTAHLNQADRTLDDRRRARVLNRADRGLASDVPTIPLYQFVVIAAYDTSVRGFRLLPWNPLWNAENWWLDR